jgi:hypothetical protein
MDLRPYVESIQRQLLVAAEAGTDEARALAEHLLAPLEAAARLALQDALAAAAEAITLELAPGSVELRLRGRDPEFVVSPPPAAAPVAEEPTAAPVEHDEGTLSRINLRLPEQLKARVEEAAAAEGLSVNAWLVRAANAGVERRRTASGGEGGGKGSRRVTGWAR